MWEKSLAVKISRGYKLAREKLTCEPSWDGHGMGDRWTQWGRQMGKNGWTGQEEGSQT